MRMRESLIYRLIRMVKTKKKHDEGDDTGDIERLVHALECYTEINRTAM